MMKTRNAPRIRGKHGFTLLELLTVIAILTLILSTVGLIRLSTAPARQAGAGARLIMGAIRVAEREAEISGLPCYLAVCREPEDPGRYLREIVLLRRTVSGWTPLHVHVLPDGIRMIPADREDLIPSWNGPISSFPGLETLRLDLDGTGSRQFLVFSRYPDGDEPFAEADYLLPDSPHDHSAVEILTGEAAVLRGPANKLSIRPGRELWSITAEKGGFPAIARKIEW